MKVIKAKRAQKRAAAKREDDTRLRKDRPDFTPAFSLASSVPMPAWLKPGFARSVNANQRHRWIGS